MTELGEHIDNKIARPGMGKLEAMWSSGLFLGRRDESGEVIVGTPRGIEFARTFQRKPVVDRWSKEEYDMFIGAPWNFRGLQVAAPSAPERYSKK